MIPEAALAIAGTDAHLVRRTPDVLHVYVGPLTPSGRFAPRSARTVCRAHTRQLRVHPHRECSQSLACTAADPHRMCARCAARLDRDRARSRRVTSGWSRTDWIREYSGTTRADVAVALEVAASPSEVDAAAWLSLLLFGVAGCNDPFSEHGRTWPSLHRLVAFHRDRVDGFPESLAREADHSRHLAQLAVDQAARDRKEVWQEREDRVARLGISNAIPARRAPPTSKS